MTIGRHMLSGFFFGGLLSLTFLTFGHHAWGQSPGVATFIIKAEPAESVASIVQSTSVAEIDLGRGATTTVSVPLNEERKVTFIVRWNDDTTSQFSVHTIAALASSNVQVVFRKEPTGSESVNRCAITASEALSLVFQSYFTCRAAALYAEKNSPQWSAVYRRAFHGWLQANYQLYTRVAPISPYGFDRDLVVKLREIVKKIDEDGYQESGFAPISLSVVRAALRLVNEEDVRMVGLVPDLVRRGQVGRALSVNEAARARFEELSARSGQTIFHGVSRETIQGNDQFIRGLIPR